ncbi:tyrosine-protein phosphatase [Pseudonocardia sp. KRD291]|uniref:tyrosine-protein phosphatase n=1 Tax=Pseudonocardia sp. KRD291 TaxID=2792007 RepID=UPI001C4A36CA|nr:tyrosine-protein phosphatase [Pseudonocardia sp. KRD291]MBW0101975.1 tyrosine-protein phosphatase [Pseudonocardia sp. KRD291]
MTDVEQDRWLQFDGLSNARDIGGLPLEGGGHVRPGVLLRTEALEYLSPGDVRRLLDVYGVVQVLDLRTDDERVRYGRGELFTAGVETHLLSFIPEEGRALPEVDEDLDPMVRNYLAYLDDRGPNVVEGVRRVAGLTDGATIVHCAAGKDRTGVLVALVESVAGVPRSDVVADYALSAVRIEEMFRRWTRSSGEAMPEDDEIDRHRPRAEVMRRFLDLLDERHGGPVAWLQAHGLTDDERDRLRDRLRGE